MVADVLREHIREGDQVTRWSGRQADQALYQAKAAGRNRVTTHDPVRKPEET